MRALIKVDAADGPRILPVRSHAAVTAKLNRFQHAVPAYPNLVILDGRPPTVNADEIVFSSKLEFHRRTRLFGQHRGNQVDVLVLVFVTEPATHVLADDLHLLLRNS